MIDFLRRHKRLADGIFLTLLSLARLCSVDGRTLALARQIHASRPAEFSLGFIVWFIRFQLGMRLPEYNIYHLIPATDRAHYRQALHRRLDDFRAAKQYFLLESEEELSTDFRQSLTGFLVRAMERPRRNTAVKTRNFDTGKAAASLRRMDELLRSQGLHPFLVSGTLLGIIRDGALIAGDNDLDIGVMADEAGAEDVFRLLQDQPAFKSVYNLGHFVQATDRNGTVIDIFIHYRENGRIWHGSDIHKWTNSDFELRELDYEGHSFLVPDNPRRYLDENYGDWSRPVLFWDYSFDTPNREFFPNRKTAYYLAERIINELGKDKPARYTVQTAVEELRSLFDIDLTAYLGNAARAELEPAQTRVVITFGTFDLFHIGHLNILQRAASFGDRLVVGVSSDAMNFDKKGIYPVYCQADRLAIVKAVDVVDDVFYEESLELKREYIRSNGAHVLVMGDDWKGRFDEFSDICEVVYLPRTENISTSETKDSIKKNL